MKVLLNKIYLFCRKFNLQIFCFFLRIRGAHINSNARFLGKPIIYGNPSNLTIHQNVTVNIGVLFNLRDRIEVMDNSSLSPFCQLHSGTLNLKTASRDHRSSPIIISENTWVASGSVILPGVITKPSEIIPANCVRHPRDN